MFHGGAKATFWGLSSQPLPGIAAAYSTGDSQNVTSIVHAQTQLFTEIDRIKIHCVSKNDTDVAHYNFDADQLILIIFRKDVVERV